jgi:VanZ family protein
MIFVLAVYWLTIFVGTHRPSRAGGQPPMNDKALHFSAYCGLSFLLCCASLPNRTWKGTFGLMAVIATYGSADELTQLLVPSRTADVADWFADVVGGLVGIGIYFVVARYLQPCLRRSPPTECQQF